MAATVSFSILGTAHNSMPYNIYSSPCLSQVKLQCAYIAFHKDILFFGKLVWKAKVPNFQINLKNVCWWNFQQYGFIWKTSVFLVTGILVAAMLAFIDCLQPGSSEAHKYPTFGMRGCALDTWYGGQMKIELVIFRFQEFQHPHEYNNEKRRKAKTWGRGYLGTVSPFKPWKNLKHLKKIGSKKHPPNFTNSPEPYLSIGWQWLFPNALEHLPEALIQFVSGLSLPTSVETELGSHWMFRWWQQ